MHCITRVYLQTLVQLSKTKSDVELKTKKAISRNVTSKNEVGDVGESSLAKRRKRKAINANLITDEQTIVDNANEEAKKPCKLVFLA